MAREVDLGSVVGPQGPRGPQGEIGPTGPRGPKGEDGKSVTIKGSVDSTSQLPQSGNSVGDGYIIDGNLHVWDGSEWNNVGKIQGPQGEKGAKGDKGDTGAAGAAATISVGSVSSGATAKVTNSGSSSAAVFNFVLPKGDKGEKGDKGDPWQISKTYESVDEMNRSYDTDGLPIGAIVAIDTGDVNDVDTGKVYVKGEAMYEYLLDLSGAQGIKGDKGEKGDKGDTGSAGAAATIRVGTVTSGEAASVTNVGTSNAAKFNFVLPKGDKGEKGDTGEKGATGSQGPKGDPGETPTFEIRDGHLYAIFED